MDILESPPNMPIGQIGTFGEFGPKYEVIGELRPLAGGDWVVAIGLVESGETAEYRLARVNDDPVAH